MGSVLGFGGRISRGWSGLGQDRRFLRHGDRHAYERAVAGRGNDRGVSTELSRPLHDETEAVTAAVGAPTEQRLVHVEAAAVVFDIDMQLATVSVGANLDA